MSDVGEIVKSGAMADLTAMLKSLAGPSIEEVGAILGDNVRVYRLKDLLRTAERPNAFSRTQD